MAGGDRGDDTARCGAWHPSLAPNNVCREPAGHGGPHVATDRYERPEYYWGLVAAADRPEPAARPTADEQLTQLRGDIVDGVTRAVLREACEQVIDVAHLTRQREWSRETFGPGPRTAGVCDHIRKELAEIEADPGDLREWVDVIILAFDGAWRTGAEPAEIIAAIKAKQARNEARTWPDWRTADPNKAIEHDRTADR